MNGLLQTKEALELPQLEHFSCCDREKCIFSEYNEELLHFGMSSVHPASDVQLLLAPIDFRLNFLCQIIHYGLQVFLRDRSLGHVF